MTVNIDLIKKIQQMESGEIAIPDDENKSVESSIKIHAYTFENEHWLAYSLKLIDKDTQNSCERVFFQILKNKDIDSIEFITSYALNLKNLLLELNSFNEDF